MVMITNTNVMFYNWTSIDNVIEANFNIGIYSELTSNYLNAGRYYFYSGIYSIDEGNSRRLYKSLKQLRKLRNFNTKINSYYIELGKKTSIYLKSLK